MNCGIQNLKKVNKNKPLPIISLNNSQRQAQGHGLFECMQEDKILHILLQNYQISLMRVHIFEIPCCSCQYILERYCFLCGCVPRNFLQGFCAEPTSQHQQRASSSVQVFVLLHCVPRYLHCVPGYFQCVCPDIFCNIVLRTMPLSSAECCPMSRGWDCGQGLPIWPENTC